LGTVNLSVGEILSKPLSKQARDRKEGMKFVLLLITIGAFSSISISSVYLTWGMMALVFFAHKNIGLAKKEIALEMGTGIIIGLIITLLRYL
jgi:hypothetical protein